MQPTGRTNFEQTVLVPLARLGRRLRAYLLLNGFALLAMALLAAALITLLVDRAVQLRFDMRLVQLISLSVLLIGLAWRWLAPVCRTPLDSVLLAHLVERWHPQVRSRLVSAVELTAQPSMRASPALVEALVRQAEQTARPLDFQKGLNHARAYRCMAALAGCLLVVLAGWMVDRQMMRIWFQRNVLLADVEWPHRHKLRLEGMPGNRVIISRGEDVSITATVEPGYEPPRQVFLKYSGAGGLTGRVQMPAIAEQSATTQPQQAGSLTGPAAPVRFMHSFERLDESLHGEISGGDAPPVAFDIEVVDRLSVDQITVRVSPPAYTRLAPYDLRTGQTVVEALQGSRIELRFRANRPLTEALLIRFNGEEEEILGPATPEGGVPEGINFTAVDQPAVSTTYYLRMTDTLGLSNVGPNGRPLRVSVRLVPDAPPQVKLKLRGAGEMITADAVVPTEVDCSDNFGLASASLVWEVTAEASTDGATQPAGQTTTQPAASEPLEPFEAGSKTFHRAIDWLPGRLGLVEGDRVALRAEARDLDDFRGPNVGRSATWALRIVSREELLVELNRREQEYRLDFERLVRQQEDLYGELLGRAAETAPPGAEQESFATLARRQRDYASRINLLRMQFEQLLSEMRINHLLTPEAEDRLDLHIAAPLEPLHKLHMPAAAEALEALDRQPAADTMAQARKAQERVLAEMKEILAHMLQWEGFQEAITLLRDIQKIQRQVSQETEKRLEQEVLGDSPKQK